MSLDVTKYQDTLPLLYEGEKRLIAVTFENRLEEGVTLDDATVQAGVESLGNDNFTVGDVQTNSSTMTIAGVETGPGRAILFTLTLTSIDTGEGNTRKVAVKGNDTGSPVQTHIAEFTIEVAKPSVSQWT